MTEANDSLREDDREGKKKKKKNTSEAGEEVREKH